MAETERVSRNELSQRVEKVDPDVAAIVEEYRGWEPTDG